MGADALTMRNVDPRSSRTITDTRHSNESFGIGGLVAALPEALGATRREFLIDSGISALKGDTNDERNAIAESGIGGTCRGFCDQSPKDTGCDTHQGSSDCEESERYAYHCIRSMGDKRRPLTESVSWRGAGVSRATKHDAKPAAVRCPTFIAAAREIGERGCGLDDVSAENCYEREIAVPLENKAAGPDQALDG